jgi:hypothetical protein
MPLMDKYYVDVTRHTTSGFLRMKLGDALQKRGVARHLRKRSGGGRVVARDRRFQALSDVPDARRNGSYHGS